MPSFVTVGQLVDYKRRETGNEDLEAPDGVDPADFFEVIEGTPGADEISGGSGLDVIQGYDGDDVIWGEGENFVDVEQPVDPGLLQQVTASTDVIGGGLGDDTIYGQGGEDSLHGEFGNDTIYGGTGADVLYGYYVAQSENTGADLVVVSPEVAIGIGSPTIPDGEDFLNPSEDDDTLYGGRGEDSIYGSYGEDTLFGGNDNDLIYGGTGDDLIHGDLGQDRIYGGLGNDTIYSGDPTGSGPGIIIGGGEEVAYGGAGNDNLYGSRSSDTLFGEEDDDTIDGQDGNDLLYGGAGNDTIYGGTSGSSLLDSSEDEIYGGAGNDDIYGGDNDDALYGGDGLDDIEGGVGDDTVYGGEGSDELFGGGGSDFIRGDAGNDFISGGGGDDVNLSGNEGDDRLFGGSGNDTLYGGNDDDELRGGNDNDTLYGDDGNDSLQGNAGNDRLYGGAGNDFLVGRSGQNLLSGGAGDDEIRAGAGDDVYGGSGFDTMDVVGPYSVEFNQGSSTSGVVTLRDGGAITFSSIENITCFTSGTRILTPVGDRKIEDLSVGDPVVTRDNGHKLLRWIGRRTVRGQADLAPILITAGTLGNDEDLLVSPHHRMLISGWRAEALFGTSEILVSACQLVNGDTIFRRECARVTYMHLLFDAHEIVYGNGAPSESFHPACVAELGEATRNEILTIFPELRLDTNRFGPTVRRVATASEAALL